MIKLSMKSSTIRAVLFFSLCGFSTSILAATAGSAAIAKELLSEYDNDKEQILSVVNAADYAVLAWAAYEKPEALKLAKDRGWSPFKTYVNDNLVLGDSVATLFLSSSGEHVLAYRGTATAGDVLTDFIGTIGLTPLSTQQMDGAREIAREVAKGFPKVKFVGHSLGGRLAHVAQIETDKPGVGFNAAPLGTDDLKKLKRRFLKKSSYIAYKSPQDPLSEMFSPDDIEVSNIEAVPKNTKLINGDYTHSIRVLATAMQEVRIAYAEGWLLPPEFDDGQVVMELPMHTIQFKEGKCNTETMNAIPRALTNFRCKQFTYKEQEFLVLENRESKNRRLWEFKVLSPANGMKELGEINSSYAAIPVLMEGKELEFLGLSTKNWGFSKKSRTLTYERFLLEGNQLVTLTGNASAGTHKNVASTASRGASGGGSNAGVEIADAFHADSIQAIKKYSKESKISIQVDSISVASGEVLVRDSQRPSAVSKNLDDMDKSFSWDKWMNATGGKNAVTVSYDVRCILTLETFSEMNLEEGKRATFVGKLRNYSGKTVLFDCRAP